MFKERDLASNLRAFQEYNEERKSVAEKIARRPSRVALQVVPTLLNLNHQDLPGYVASAEKYTILPFYQTDDSAAAVCEENVKHFASVYNQIKQTEGGNIYGAIPRSLAHSLFVMGSVGSIAQTEKSDFDYWLVLDEGNLQPAELDYIKQKAKALEEWGDREGVELHFFLTDVKKVRENDFGSVDKESAGSSQALLLKEEFYRTAMLVAGRYPVWWAVPPGTDDAGYDQAMEVITGATSMDPIKFVNMGNIHTIPDQEFFGAALWQINKAMDSPFKSVMKMAVLESFIAAHGEAKLLCDELKEKVIAGDMPDPYCLMIDRLAGHYEAQNRHDLVDLINRSFYNKVHIKINDTLHRKTSLTPKETTMMEYVKNWGWTEKIVNEMNEFDNWPFEKMSEMGSQLHSFMIETYKNLTNDLKNRQSWESMISKQDLTMLGNKIFAFYSRKPGKVDLVKKAFDGALHQESVTFQPLIIRGKKPVWVALRGNMTTQIARKEPVHFAEVRKSTVLAELVAWLWVNGIIDEKSFLHLVPSHLPVSMQGIQSLTRIIDEFIPYKSISSFPSQNFFHRPAITKLMVIANFSSQPWVKTIEEVTLLYRNNHGESFLQTFSGKEGAVEAGKIYAEAMKSGIREPHKFLKIFIPKAENSHKLEKQLNNFIRSRVKLNAG